MPWFTLDDVTWAGVALATVAGFAVGAIWYHDKLFGRAWMRLVGLTEEDLRVASPVRYVGAGIALFVSALVLNVLMVALDDASVGGGALLGAFLALVFRLGNHVVHHGFELKPPALTFINGVHDIVALSAAGAIIGAFL